MNPGALDLTKVSPERIDPLLGMYPVALIPISLILLVVLLFVRRGYDARTALATSFLLIALFIAVTTEAASALDAVARGVLTFVWAGFALVLVGALAIQRPWGLAGRAADSLRGWSRLTGLDRLMAAIVAVILAVTLLIALAAPPNNWDSMTYHMARVAEWISRQSVAFYPTAIERQNFLMPLAEYQILHLQLLSGSDHFANLVQWWSFFVAILLASLIVRELGQPGRAQLLAALLAATIPMAILQASSTQNDLVAASFCLAFAYFLLRLVRSLTLQDALLAGIALGLALLTKGTAYIYCAAIGLGIGVGSLLFSERRATASLMLRRFVLLCAVGLVLNAGFFWRNYQLYGNVLGGNNAHYTNEKLTADILAANLLRNAALHLDTPSEPINAQVLRVLQGVLGDRINDPRSTLAGTVFLVTHAIDEDSSGNLVHLVLICLAFLVLLVSNLPGKRKVYLYASVVLLAILLYAAAFRWQPWATRLHTTIFLLAAPLIAVVVMGFPKARRILVPGVVVLVVAYSVPYLVANPSRPLLPQAGRSVFNTSRLQQYFAVRPYLYQDYAAAMDAVRQLQVEEVGLLLDEDGWEYPLWVLAGSEASGAPHFRHVGVTNITGTLDAAKELPQAIVTTLPIDASPLAGLDQEVIFQSEQITVVRLEPPSK